MTINESILRGCWRKIFWNVVKSFGSVAAFFVKTNFFSFIVPGLGKVVFIAYKGVEDFLRPEPTMRQGMDLSEDGYSEHSNMLFNSGTHVVNSRVVAASVGRHRNSHLPQPITVTLKHIQVFSITCYQ